MTGSFFPRAGDGDVKVFFSYARQSEERSRFAHSDEIHRLTEAIYRALDETPGVSVFRDVRDMPGGAGIDASIAGAIEECDVGIVIWSSWSIASGHVTDEADALMAAGKYLGVNVEPARAYQLPFGLRRVHVLDLSLWSGERALEVWRLLVSNLFNIAKHDAAAPPLDARTKGRQIFSDGQGLPELRLFDLKGPKGLGAADASRKHEGPKINVTFNAPFALGVAPVSVGEWNAARAGGAPIKELSASRGDNDPVTGVSWLEAVSYLSWLNYRLGADLYRLPSESQWEGGMRASVEESEGGASGALQQPTGLIWQWTADSYHPNRERDSRDGAPYVRPGGFYKVIRGGSVKCLDSDRSYTARSGVHERHAADDIGFRVMRLMTPGLA